MGHSDGWMHRAFVPPGEPPHPELLSLLLAWRRSVDLMMYHNVALAIVARGHFPVGSAFVVVICDQARPLHLSVVEADELEHILVVVAKLEHFRKFRFVQGAATVSVGLVFI